MSIRFESPGVLHSFALQLVRGWENTAMAGVLVKDVRTFSGNRQLFTLDQAPAVFFGLSERRRKEIYGNF
jgi:hypothetical protein